MRGNPNSILQIPWRSHLNININCFTNDWMRGNPYSILRCQEMSPNYDQKSKWLGKKKTILSTFFLWVRSKIWKSFNIFDNINSTSSVTQKFSIPSYKN